MTRTLRNWSGSVWSHPQTLHTPSTDAEIQDIVTTAAEQGQRVRVRGAGHSFTPVAASNDQLLQLDRLSGLISADANAGRARFRAGTRLRDIPALLAAHGLALPNQGDVDPQALAGAVSTGTHGTGLAFTGFAGAVTALTLIDATGTRRELSPTREPELFDHARVSLGVLGVLTEIELMCVPAFDLIACETAEPFDEIRSSIVDRARAADHIEFYWFPHSERAAVKTNTRISPGAQAPAELAHVTSRPAWLRMLSEEVVDNAALAAICALGARLPALVPHFNRLATAAVSNRAYRAAAHEVFVSPRRVRFNEMEYAVPLASGPEVLAEIARTIASRGWKISFPLEVRVAAADDVPMSTASGREVMYIAVHRYVEEEWEPYFRTLEDILLAAGGRPHWGKLHRLGYAQLAERYPRFEEFCALRESLDPAGMFSNDYTDTLFIRPGHG